MAAIPVPLIILRALADETLRRLALAPNIEQPGESGRAREQTLIAFIEQLIPSSFGVSTGFVVDALGGKSRQIDVVVYRTDYHPVFEIGRVKHFMVESVVAALEVKAAIDSEEDLKMALDNIASVKSLDRSNRGRNYEVIDYKRGNFVNLANLAEQDTQIFGAIVTEKSLVRDFSKDFLAWLKIHSRREWPNIYVDVHQFTARYQYIYSVPGVTPFRTMGPRTMDADALAISKPGPDVEAPLVVLGANLFNQFRVAPRIDFRLTTSPSNMASTTYWPFLLPEAAREKSRRMRRSREVDSSVTGTVAQSIQLACTRAVSPGRMAVNIGWASTGRFLAI